MKKVFLTGASSGIGLAVAKSLLARGDEVWGTSRDPSQMSPLPGLHTVRLDLLDPNSIEQAFKSALFEAGHFDVVINNAGSGHLDRKSTRLNSSHVSISYAVFCLKKKK